MRRSNKVGKGGSLASSKRGNRAFTILVYAINEIATLRESVGGKLAEVK
jgi:hypothetical protein